MMADWHMYLLPSLLVDTNRIGVTGIITGNGWFFLQLSL
jgi:hypothetical protein